MSGVSFCGPDIGGFMGAPSPDLFTRWIQLGTFMPFFRTHTHHGSPDQEPWSYGDWHEEINKKFIQLRYKLMPYLYDAIYQSSISNMPVLRPMILEFQNDPNTQWMDDQFMFGDDLLVAPIYKENQTARKVYFPEGAWYDYWTDEKITGPMEKLVDAPLDKIPIFVKAGAIIPEQEPQNFIGEKKPEQLVLNIYPKHGTFKTTFYEDDGSSFEYEKGQYCITAFQISKENNRIEFSVNKKSGKYKPVRRTYLAVFHNVKQIPQQFTLNEASLPVRDSNDDLKNLREDGCFYNSAQQKFYVKFKDTNNFSKVSLVY